MNPPVAPTMQSANRGANSGAAAATRRLPVAPARPSKRAASRRKILISHPNEILATQIASYFNNTFDVIRTVGEDATATVLDGDDPVAWFTGHQLGDNSALTLLHHVSDGGDKTPGAVFLLRSGRDFPFGRMVRRYKGAFVIDFRADLPRVVKRVCAVSARRAEQEWGALESLPRELLTSQKRLFDSFFAGGATGPLDHQAIDAGADLMARAAEQDELVSVLDVLKTHDDYTFRHVFNVASHMTLFAHVAGIHGDDLRLVARAGTLHDIGKSRTPLSVLHKPGPLDEAEWRIMRGHVTDSERMLREADGVAEAVVRAAAEHHEKLDGSGYPRGLKGTQIHELSLVCAVADVFSALVDARPYKAGMTSEAALEIMGKMSGSHLEPGMVALFAQLVLDRGL